MSFKTVRATYSREQIFIIPQNIDLEDESLVKDWGIKYSTLYIYLVNGKVIEIESRINNLDDTKRPDESFIEDLEESCADIDEDDEGFEEIDITG